MWCSSRFKLGSLLSLLSINDFPNVSSVLFSLYFVDGSHIIVLGKNLDDRMKTKNEEMIKVVDWLRTNKLSLNLMKTHCVIFRKERGESPHIMH